VIYESITKERLAIFAVIITMLVLQMRLPSHELPKSGTLAGPCAHRTLLRSIYMLATPKG
jgi:uncharacterized membrane protein